jgi:hypothetical protein
MEDFVFSSENVCAGLQEQTTYTSSCNEVIKPTVQLSGMESLNWQTGFTSTSERKLQCLFTRTP